MERDERDIIPDEIKGIAVAIIVLLIIFLGARFFRATYTPTNSKPGSVDNSEVVSKPPIFLACSLVVSEAQQKSGIEMPGLDVGGVSGLTLLRPAGEALSQSLFAALKKEFKDVSLLVKKDGTEARDVVVELVGWKFGKATGYNFTGLPVILASGDGHATLNVEVEVSGPKITSFRLNESATGTCQLGITLLPVSRLARTMTEATDIAAAYVSQKIVGQIVKNTQISAFNISSRGARKKE